MGLLDEYVLMKRYVDTTTKRPIKKEQTETKSYETNLTTFHICSVRSNLTVSLIFKNLRKTKLLFYTYTFECNSHFTASLKYSTI